MGKLLKILGVVFIVLVLGFAGLLYWSHEKGESVQEDFFSAVLAGDVAKVKALFKPEVAEQIDDPYLGAWMGAVKLHLGEFQGLAATDFHTSVKKVDGVERVESKGTVNFARGDAQSILILEDDKIVAFHVNSKAFPANWFTRLDDTGLYEQRASDFLRALVAGDVEAARAPMHADLQAQLPAEKLAAMVAPLAARYGTPRGTRILGTELEMGARPVLVVRVQVDGETRRDVGRVRFGFVDLRGVVIQFDLPED